MEPPTVREVIGRLEKDGWKLVRIRGDHRRFEKGGRYVTVPGNLGSHLKKGTYSSIKRTVGW